VRASISIEARHKLEALVRMSMSSSTSPARNSKSVAPSISTKSLAQKRLVIKRSGPSDAMFASKSERPQRSEHRHIFVFGGSRDLQRFSSLRCLNNENAVSRSTLVAFGKAESFKRGWEERGRGEEFCFREAILQERIASTRTSALSLEKRIAKRPEKKQMTTGV